MLFKETDTLTLWNLICSMAVLVVFVVATKPSSQKRKHKCLWAVYNVNKTPQRKPVVYTVTKEEYHLFFNRVSYAYIML